MDTNIFFKTPDRRKQDIITSALRIIDQRGIKGLTIARLAKEVGFVESALYRHFRSKRELISFIIDQIRSEAQRHFDEVEEQLKDSLQALQHLLQLHLRFLQEYPGIFRIIYSDEIQVGDKGLQRKLNKLISEIIEFIRNRIQTAKEAQQLNLSVDSSIAAIHFLGLIYTSFSYWTLHNRSLSLYQLGEALWQQYLQGVKA